MSYQSENQPAGWYYAQGDPVGTQRYWDGNSWQGGPQPVQAGVGANTGPQSGVAEASTRMLGRFLDAIAWLVLGSIAFYGGGSEIVGIDTDNPQINYTFLTLALAPVLICAYEILMVGLRGATLGKLALGLKVMNADGTDVGFPGAVRRMILYAAISALGLIGVEAVETIGGFLLLGVFIAGVVMLFTEPRRQTPWDKVANTIVVSTR